MTIERKALLYEDDNGRSWKVLRYLSRYLNPIHLHNLTNNYLTTFSLLDDWCQVAQPGDRVEIADIQDLATWIYGELIYIKKTRIKDISVWSLEHSLSRYTYAWGDFDKVPTLDFTMYVISQMYEEPVTLDTIVYVRCIFVDRVEIPAYSLNLE